MRRPRQQRPPHVEPLEGRSYLSVSFGQPVQVRVARGPIAVADFNLDGKPDLLLASGGEDVVRVLLGNGDGTFAAASLTTPAPNAPLPPLIGDLNEDGKPDVVVQKGTDFGGGVFNFDVQWMAGRGDGTFEAPVNLGFGLDEAVDLVLADLNGDGHQDLAAQRNSGTRDLLVYRGHGDGTVETTPVVTTPGGQDILRHFVADFNGDAHLDFLDVSVVQNEFAVALYTGNGDLTLDPAVYSTSPGRIDGFFGAPTAAVEDMDGDGDLDLVLGVGAGASGASTIAVMTNNGSGSFTTASQRTAAGTGFDTLVIDDFDQDGKADVAVGGGIARIDVYLGNGDGTFADPLGFKGSGVSPLLSADLDGDAKPELIVPSTGTGSYVLRNGQTGGETPTDVDPVQPDLQVDIAGALPATVTAGDAGRTSVVVRNEGPSAFQGPLTLQLFVSPDPTLDDSDIAVGKPITKKLKIFASDDAKPIKMAFNYPFTSAGPVYVVARVSQSTVTEFDATNNATAIATPVAVTAASTNLSAAIASSVVKLQPGKRSSVALTLEHLGNVVAAGTVSFVLKASPDGSPTGAVDLLAAPVVKKVKLKPGKRLKVSLKALVPAGLAAGSYRVRVEMTPSLTPVADGDASNDVAVSTDAFAVV